MQKFDVYDDKGNHYTVSEREEHFTPISDLKEEARYDVEEYGGLSKIRSLLLCLMFGWLGAHKFYEGKTGMGILYIFTGGLFAIGIWVDFIVILAHEGKFYNPNDKPTSREILKALGKTVSVLAILSLINFAIIFLLTRH